MKRLLSIICAAVLAAAAITGCDLPQGSNTSQKPAAIDIVSPEESGCSVDYDESTRTLTISGRGEFRPGDDPELQRALAAATYPEKVVISPGITVLGEYCFSENEDEVVEGNHEDEVVEGNHFDRIKTIEIADTVTAIEDFALPSESLTSVKLPGKLVYLGSYAFSCCDKMTEIEIPGSVSTIPCNCFFGNKNLKRVVLGEGVAVIEDGAFDACDSLEELVLNDGLTVIAPCAFSDCERLSDIELPESLKIIGNNAFINCSAMKSVTIPESVEYIGRYAFGYNSYGEYFDEDTNRIEGFTIKGVRGSAAQTYARQNGFAFEDEDGNITTESEPAVARYEYDENSGSLRVYGDGIISNPGDYDETVPWSKKDLDIKSVTVEDGVTAVDEISFYASQNNGVPLDACGRIETVKLSGSVRYIGGGAFYDCLSLRDISFENGLRFIESMAFDGCKSLKQISLPETVQYIDYSFGRCTGLESIDLSRTGVASIDRVCSDCDSLKEVKLPDSLSAIGSGALMNCPSLKSITIPKSVRYIGPKAFGYYYVEKDGTDAIEKTDGFVVKGCKNTAAEQYALDNGFSFEAMD